LQLPVVAILPFEAPAVGGERQFRIALRAIDPISAPDA
jgi:hypothetical protein